MLFSHHPQWSVSSEQFKNVCLHTNIYVCFRAWGVGGDSGQNAAESALFWRFLTFINVVGRPIIEKVVRTYFGRGESNTRFQADLK